MGEKCKILSKHLTEYQELGLFLIILKLLVLMSLMLIQRHSKQNDNKLKNSFKGKLKII